MKVKCFTNERCYRLESDINDFIEDKDVVNVSYSTEKVGYSTWHYAMVLYK